MSIDRVFFTLQPIISKFYFRSLKNGSQSLGTLTDECEQYKGLHYQFEKSYHYAFCALILLKTQMVAVLHN